MGTARVAVATLIVAIGVSASLRAHHSFAAEFDANQPVTLKGTVVKMEWINPHSWIHLDVKNTDGSVTRWMIEGGTPNTLVRRGFTKASLAPGTEIVIEGFRAKNGANRANGADLILPDGKRLFMGSSGTGAPKDPKPAADPLVTRALLRAAALWACMASLAWAQGVDLALVNGKVVTLDAQSTIAEAVAITGDRITAVGASAAVRRLTGPRTQVIDLGGRTVIPGLIDSHLHAIRAALSFSTEVNWIGAPSLKDALGRISTAAKAMRPGAWLIVAGGWNEQQFTEKRRPTQAELEAAAPNNPVYVQLGYGWVAMTEEGFTKLGIKSDADLPRGARLEVDAGGKPLGTIAGSNPGIVALFDRLPKPTYAEQVDGTRAFFRELNRLALTGVGDPGGNNLAPPDYAALFDVWRRGEMTVRVRYTLNGQTRGKELDEFKAWTGLLPMGFGDDWLKFIGLGERVTEAMNNNPSPTADDLAKYEEIARWAAGRSLGLTMHWGSDANVRQLLDIFERVNRDVPLKPLRWSIAHLNDASEASLERMRGLGIGWTVQDAMYFGGDGFERQNGAAAARRAPPVVTASKFGIPIGAGTDAHRVASYNPFTALQWFLDGKTVSGRAIRGPEETPSRLDALRFYTIGSAWFSHEDRTRGSIETGKLADLAVLSQDYLTAPVEKIGSTVSLLTVVDGRVVYADKPFEARAGR